MAISTTETQVTWSAASSLSVSASGNGTSDAFSIDATCFQMAVQCKVDNDGTPAAGDTVDFYLLATLGDPDGASTDEYGTTTQGTHLCRLNTNTTDPAITTVWIPGPLKGGKIYAVNNSSARAQTVSTTILEQRSG